ncbi:MULTISPECIES: hypothetical protein [Methanosarcina]|uniref:hypothetical protein n=1 Tax=Methanosarcina TaxID=2207 RepID=UPI0012E0A43E|nr:MULTISPECIES: hypothetical protein [Methanosarcina]
MKPAIVLKLQVSFPTPKYDEESSKMEQLLYFFVVETPLNLKRIQMALKNNNIRHNP